MSLSAKKQEIAAKSEPILFGVSCLRHTGLIAHSGVLELTLGQLRFRPLSGKSRNNSNISILIPTEYIRSARIVGRERHLIIKTGRESVRFSGQHVGRFRYRLTSLIANLRGVEAPKIPQFHTEERVLCFSQCRLFRPEEGVSRGEIVLSDTRLRFFEYETRRSQKLNPMASYQLGLDQISRFQLEGLTQKLRIDSGSGSTQISGSSTATLYALLKNLCRRPDPDDDDLIEEQSHLAMSGPATRIKGLRRTQGLLVIGGDTIQFIPTGFVNQMLGSKPVRIPFSQVTRASKKEGQSGVLRLRDEDSYLKLKLEDCEGWFNELSSQLMDWLELRTQAGEDSEAGSKLGSWRFRVNRQAIDEANWVLPVVRQQENQIDAMMISHSRSEVRMASLFDGSEAPYQSLDSMDVKRVWDDLADPRHIRFKHNRERYILAAAGGATSVTDFWSRCRTPSRVFSYDALQAQDWSPILGIAHFLKVIPESGSPIAMKDSRIMKHADGLALIVPGESEECTFLGQDLQIHFSHEEGMCELESLAIWATSVPTGITIPNRTHPHYMLLVIRLPDEIRAFNARKSFRVPAVQQVSLLRFGHPDEDMQNVMADDWVELGEPFDGTLINISAIGCAILTKEQIEPDNQLQITLTIEGRALLVKGLIVRNREIQGEEGPMWEHGLEFINMDRSQTNTITKAVRQVQLYLLAQKEMASE